MTGQLPACRGHRLAGAPLHDAGKGRPPVLARSGYGRSASFPAADRRQTLSRWSRRGRSPDGGYVLIDAGSVMNVEIHED